MVRSLHRWKRNRKIKKVKKGDGHSLKPYRLWHIFTRSLFFTELKNENGETTMYAVNYKYWAEEPTAELYRNGKHVASSKLPAAFPVPDGVIEVATGTYGINRMHYITDKNTYPLYPDKRSIRGLRMRFDKSFPRTSSFIGKIAVVVLLISLILSFPQLIETISQIPWISENIGVFDSPIKFPIWANITLLIAGGLAGFERALMLRNHWLIDMETSYWDN